MCSQRLTIEMTKRATVIINSFRRKSGVHSVMSPRQIVFGKKFKTPLCKMGELVLTYDVLFNNKTSKPTAFYALYIWMNDGGTGHSVFKLSTKKMILTPRCKPIPMPDDIIKVVNKWEKIMDRWTEYCFVIYSRNQLLMIFMETSVHKTIVVVLSIRIGT